MTKMTNEWQKIHLTRNEKQRSESTEILAEYTEEEGAAVTDKPTQRAALLETNTVDALSNRVVTELSWQCFASTVVNVQLPHLHLT